MIYNKICIKLWSCDDGTLSLQRRGSHSCDCIHQINQSVLPTRREECSLNLIWWNLPSFIQIRCLCYPLFWGMGRYPYILRHPVWRHVRMHVKSQNILWNSNELKCNVVTMLNLFNLTLLNIKLNYMYFQNFFCVR